MTKGTLATKTSSIALHRAAFENDVPTLEQLLKTSSPEDLASRDVHGNTPLHLAVIAGNHGAIAVLLAAGASPEVKSGAKWTALDDAIAQEDQKSIKLLLETLRLEVKKERKAMKARIKPVLLKMPDFSIQLRWELGSPLFGWILRRYAPDDTYTIYKVGLRLRVDGSLRGMDPTSRALLPRWRKGPFSLLMDASTTPVTWALVDYTDKTWVDLYSERKAAVKDLDQDARDLIDAGAGRVRLKGSELDFTPATTWLGRPSTTVIDGYNTQVFEAIGRMVALIDKHNPWKLPPGMTYDDYLQSAKAPKDEREEVPWDPLQGPPPSVAQAFAEDEEAQLEIFSKAGGRVEAREINGRCWMAKDHPMTLKELLPLMEAMGAANKHVSAAIGFIKQYHDHSMFPMKVRVPLMWTVYLMMRFRSYRQLLAGHGEAAVEDPAFFQVPSSFKKIQLGEFGPTEETFYEAREQ